MKRKASAVWEGSLTKGHGTVSTESGVLKNNPYSFATRFGDEPGTNPEELIGAAHAGCFSMALSAQLGEAGLTPDRIATSATVTVEKLADGFAVTAVHLVVTAKIPGTDAATFTKIAQQAKEGCPISKLLKAEITLEATLEE